MSAQLFLKQQDDGRWCWRMGLRHGRSAMVDAVLQSRWQYNWRKAAVLAAKKWANRLGLEIDRVVTVKDRDWPDALNWSLPPLVVRDGQVTNAG